MFEELFSQSGLSLDRLRSFLEMAGAGSIAKAAKRDANRQSLISRQIRELEEFFGVELTVRRGKSLALSEEGRRLEELIRGQFQDLSDFMRRQQNEWRVFSVGAGASILEWLVIPEAARIRETLGPCCLRFSSMRSQDLVEAVRDGRLDFAIVRQDALPDGAPSKRLLTVMYHLCVHERLVASLPKHKWDNPGFWSQLPFAANVGGGQLDQLFRTAMIQQCGTFRPAFECDSVLQIKELVRRGQCAGVLSSIGLQGLKDAGVLVRPFTPLASYGRPLVLHWNQRQMKRRGIEASQLSQIAKSLKTAAFGEAT